MSTATSPKNLRIGVMLEAVQLADIVGVDVFGNLSVRYVQAVASMDPTVRAVAQHAMDIEFFYISNTLDPTTLTPGGASLRVLPTHTYDTVPRDLDILLIGGPLPAHRPSAADRFMKEAWTKTRVWMTTCVGSVWLASTGLLEGKKVTTNRAFLGAAREMYPGTEWVDRRWVVVGKDWQGEGEGELWTSGAAGAGVDMIAAYALREFDPGFVRVVALEALEFMPGGRGEEYETGGYLEGLDKTLV